MFVFLFNCVTKNWSQQYPNETCNLHLHVLLFRVAWFSFAWSLKSQELAFSKWNESQLRRIVFVHHSACGPIYASRFLWMNLDAKTSTIHSHTHPCTVQFWFNIFCFLWRKICFVFADCSVYFVPLTSVIENACGHVPGKYTCIEMHVHVRWMLG